MHSTSDGLGEELQNKALYNGSDITMKRIQRKQNHSLLRKILVLNKSLVSPWSLVYLSNHCAFCLIVQIPYGLSWERDLNA